MAGGSNKPSLEIPNPIEMALEMTGPGAAPPGVAEALLRAQERLIRAQMASERVGLLLKILTGLAGLAAADWALVRAPATSPRFSSALAQAASARGRDGASRTASAKAESEAGRSAATSSMRARAIMQG